MRWIGSFYSFHKNHSTSISKVMPCSCFLCFFHCLSSHRQTPAYHPPRPVQPDPGDGQCCAAEVSGIWRPHPLRQLAEGRGQSTGKGLPHVAPGAGQPANQKHQGNRFSPLCFFWNIMGAFTQALGGLFSWTLVNLPWKSGSFGEVRLHSRTLMQTRKSETWSA